VAKRDKEEREERARVAKRDREERSRVEREEESERVIRQKIEGGKEITIYVNAWAIDRKLGHIKLVVQQRQYTSSEVDDRKCCRTNYPRNDHI
jgi:hypothetical protein